MALGANFDVDLGLGGTSLDDITASAGNSAVNVVRMDTLFHSFHLNSGSDVLGPYLMYVPITTFNIGYPVERPWKRLPYYYSTILKECKRENKVFSIQKSPLHFHAEDFNGFTLCRQAISG